ncbi:MAG: mechanosensitive ion channel family protein [Candidatus Rifleibacteriota bacterium]
MDYLNQLWNKLPATGWQASALNVTLIVLATIVVGLLLVRVAVSLMKKMSMVLAAKDGIPAFNFEYCRRPFKILFPAIIFRFLFPFLMVPASLGTFIKQVTALWIIAAITYLAVVLTDIFVDIFLSYYDIASSDNFSARAIHTQVKLIQRVIVFTIILIGLASFLMTFDKVKEIGVSLLASAGVLGIILGFSAQKCISTLIAGIQIAITQPIRLEDVVVVENEWGWIEEITLSYVVVRIWDLRRLVLPVSYFIEKPFQNWTRGSANILGSVYLYTDYSVDVEKLREKFKSILQKNPLWDKKACALQVTNTTDKVMEIRALLSTEDSPKAWTLRCQVREELISYLQKEFPDCLPRVRLQMDNLNKALEPAQVT